MKEKDIIDALNWRYATKKFDAEKRLSSVQIDTLLESLRLSASSYGLQPWKFVIVENPELRAKLREVSWGQSQVTDASHLIVLCRLDVLDVNHVEKYTKSVAETRGLPMEALDGYKNMMLSAVSGANANGTAGDWSKNQVYIALGTLLETAALLGVDTCPLEWLDAAKYDDILELDKLGLKTCVACTVGFRSSEDQSANYKKVRFLKEEIIIKM